MTPQLAPDLRSRAEGLGAALPALLAQAEHLSATVILGEHGRRRAGMGDEFWQYRPASAGDSAGSVDWRRSARSDQHFVREREWQAAQTVALWVDPSRAMQFSGDPSRAPKTDRAHLLALALSVLLLRGGERVGLAGGDTRPRAGRAQILHLMQGLTTAAQNPTDYGSPDVAGLTSHGRAVFFSDFLGNPEDVETALGMASDRGVRGALVQILDPAEEEFPFDGRTIFESMGGSLRHETLRAGDLRTRYLDRLAERKAHIQSLARASGWHYLCHHTGQSAQSALLWLYAALERGR
ncbi:Protein of unknown function DUF58 [Pseudorhodobacter antarcticus]|uniref:DUF58 domain-containing protein n=1 Tax=Pseudorhodobacter antarcticus TaxID=1077947 RepID=A0A1H8B3Q2_9RHOB|nr:DUF58 domain-containing protein [Pseudorhodobacter antarcticus]SEM77403.1 Protein of unknown function DUF58 [Pseudorhodobacter antarcticus]